MAKKASDRPRCLLVPTRTLLPVLGSSCPAHTHSVRNHAVLEPTRMASHSRNGQALHAHSHCCAVSTLPVFRSCFSVPDGRLSSVAPQKDHFHRKEAFLLAAMSVPFLVLPSFCLAAFPPKRPCNMTPSSGSRLPAWRSCANRALFSPQRAVGDRAKHLQGGRISADHCRESGGRKGGAQPSPETEAAQAFSRCIPRWSPAGGAPRTALSLGALSLFSSFFWPGLPGVQTPPPEGAPWSSRASIPSLKRKHSH